MGATVAHAMTVVPATTSGNYDITTTDLGGLTPKGAILYVNYSTGTTDTKNSSPTEDLRGISVFDGTRSRCAVDWALDASNNTAARRAQYDDRVVQLFTGSSTLEGTATASFITNGIRLNYTSTADYAHTVVVIFFAGASVQAYAADATCPHGSGTGTTSITAPGFEPDIAFFFGTTAGSFSQAPTVGQTLTHGWAINKTGVPQYSHSNFRNYNSTVDQHLSGGAVFEKCAVVNTQDNTMYRAYRVSAFDADGFDLAFEPGTQGTYDLNAGYICVDLDGTDFDLDVLSFNGGPASLSAWTGFEAQFVHYGGSTYDSLIDASTIVDTGYGGHQDDEGAGVNTYGFAANHGTVREDCFNLIAGQTGDGQNYPTAAWYHDRMRFADFTENDEKTMSADVSFGSTSTTWTIDSGSQTTTTRLWVLSIEKNSVALNGNDITTGTPTLTSGTVSESHAFTGSELVTQVPDVMKAYPDIVQVIGLQDAGTTTATLGFPVTLDTDVEAILVFITSTASPSYPANVDGITATFDGDTITPLERFSTSGTWSAWLGYLVAPTTGSLVTFQIINDPGDPDYLHGGVIVGLRNVDTSNLIVDSQSGTANLTGMVNTVEGLTIGGVWANYSFPHNVETDDQIVLSRRTHSSSNPIGGLALTTAYEQGSPTWIITDAPSMGAEVTAAAIVRPYFVLPAISVALILDGNGITTGAPTLSSGSLAQDHTLDATDISTGAPTVSTGTLAQPHTLAGSSIATGAPTITSPTIVQAHILDASDISTGAPTLTAGAIAQGHVLDASDISTGAPDLPTPTLALGAHTIDGNDITTGAPTLSSGSLSQSHSLDGIQLTPLNPQVSGGPTWWKVTGASDPAVHESLIGTGNPAGPGSTNWRYWTWATMWRDRNSIVPTNYSVLDTSAVAADDFILQKSRNDDGYSGSIRLLNPDGWSIINYIDATAEPIDTDDPAWHTLVVQYDGSVASLTVWWDGVQVAQSTGPDGAGTTDLQTWPFWMRAMTWYFHQQGPTALWGELLDGTQRAELEAQMVIGSIGDGSGVLFQSHILDATDVATGAPTLSSGSIAQDNVLDASDVLSGSPTLSTGTLAQAHTLGAGAEVVAGNPTVTTGTFSQDRILEGNDFSTGPSTVSVGAIAQDHVLDAADLASGAPDLDGWSVTIRRVLDADDISTGNPTVSTATISQSHSLNGGGEISPEIVEVPTPTLVERHNFDGIDISTGAPDLFSPALVQFHTIDGDSLTTGNPIVPTPSLTGANELLGNSITTGAPTLSAGALSQSHSLESIKVLTTRATVTGGPLFSSITGADAVDQIPQWRGEYQDIPAEYVAPNPAPTVWSWAILTRPRYERENTRSILYLNTDAEFRYLVQQLSNVEGESEPGRWRFFIPYGPGGYDGTQLYLTEPFDFQGTDDPYTLMFTVDEGAGASGEAKIYVDGILTHTFYLGGPGGIWRSSPWANAGGSHHAIDGGALYVGTALTQAQVTELHNKMINGPLGDGTGLLLQSHILDGDDVAGSAPSVSSGSIAQVHALDASDVLSGSPTLSTGAIAQAHALAGAELLSGVPDLDGWDFVYRVGIDGDDLVGSAPDLGDWAISQSHILDGADLTGSAPVLPTPTLYTDQVLDGDGITTGAPDLSGWTFIQDHILDGDRITTAPSDVPEIAISQLHVLDGVGISTQAPFIQPNIGGTLHQDHVLDGVGISTQSPTLSVGGLSEDNVLDGEGVSTQSPTLSSGTIAQDHVLDGNNITTRATIIPIPSFAGYLVLRGDPVYTKSPTLSSGSLSQSHNLDGEDLVGSAPTLTAGTAGESTIRFGPGDLVGLPPVLSEGTVSQIHVFPGDTILSGVPVLTEGIMDPRSGLRPETTLIVGEPDRTMVLGSRRSGIMVGRVDRTSVIDDPDRTLIIRSADKVLVVS